MNRDFVEKFKLRIANADLIKIKSLLALYIHAQEDVFEGDDPLLSDIIQSCQSRIKELETRPLTNQKKTI